MRPGSGGKSRSARVCARRGSFPALNALLRPECAAAGRSGVFLRGFPRKKPLPGRWIFQENRFFAKKVKKRRSDGSCALARAEKRVYITAVLYK